MSPSPRFWVELARPASLAAPGDPASLGTTTGWERRSRAVDAGVCFLAAALGALFLSPALHGDVVPLPAIEVVVDVACGLLACLALWWRRRWAIGVALTCVVLGTISISATPAGLLALFSLAVHRPVRPALLTAALFVGSALVFAVYSPTTGPVSVFLRVTPLALGATAWGMFIRARRQLLLSLRERALRAEADQRLHEDQARMAERTRIAREMHDVLAHRLSLLALHAGGLEVRPDLPPAEVRETAGLLRSTARQALEELRGVIGVLRDESGQELAPPGPQPTLVDIRRLVEETRRVGGSVDLELRVERADDLPGGLGRDAYRIVQESLTNIAKHAGRAETRVRVTGAPGDGLHVSVRNARSVPAQAGPSLPGSGSGLLGLQERVALAGGTLVHGPDQSGDFVVEAEFPW
jgi:signal transduction histidine kinase